MMKDEIVEEVRKVRESYAEQFNYDLAAICRDLRERERTSGREYVTLSPRRTVPASKVASLADPKSEAGSNLPVTVSRES